MKSSLAIFCLLALVSCGKRTVTETITVTSQPQDSRMTCKVYEVIGRSTLPNFSLLNSLGEVKVSELDSPKSNTTESFKALSGTPHESLVEQFGLDCIGELVAKQSGTHTINLNSDDGSRLSLNDFPLISNNDGLHSMTQKSVNVMLVKGQSYKIRVEYFQNFGEKGLVLSIKRPNVSLTEIVKF